MEEFVERLWGNPSLHGLSVLKKENQILSFIKENTTQLKKSMKDPRFFPDLSWDDVARLLLSELTDRVIHSIDDDLEKLIRELFNRENITRFFPGADFDERTAVSFKSYLVSLMRTKVLRDHIINTIISINFGFYEKYLPLAIERRKVIYYELTRRDRLEIPAESIPDYLKFCSLFRHFFWMKLGGEGQNSVTLAGSYRNKKNFEGAMSKLDAEVRSRVEGVSVDMYRPGLDSWISCIDFPDVSAASKVISILMNRGQEYDPTQLVDRGAESPDKSWFNINRRAARFYGYDSKYLDELYQIASEEGW